MTNRRSIFAGSAGILPARGPQASCLFVTLLLFAGVGAACTNPSANSISPSIPVKVSEVREQNGARMLKASGNLAALETAPAAFEIPGRVTRIYVELGDHVEAGQILAELDHEEIGLLEEAARAQSEAAKASSDLAQEGARQEEIDAAQATEQQAEAASRLARSEYERAEFLFKRKSLTASDMERARTERDLAENRLREAQARLSALQTGLREEEKRRAASAADAADAQAQVARKKVANARLRSPITGYVAQKDLRLGQVIAPGIPAFVIVKTDPLKLVLGVTEEEISKLPRGARGTVTLQALPGRELVARAEHLGVAADPVTRLFPVEMLLGNPQLELRPGMIAEVSIPLAGNRRLVTLPSTAIVRTAEGRTAVFVADVNAGRAFSRPVETGEMRGEEIEIRSGVKPGEMIVTEGQHRLSDASPILIVGRSSR